MKKHAVFAALILFCLTACSYAGLITLSTSLTIDGQSDIIVHTDDSSLAQDYLAKATLSAGSIIHNATDSSITGGTYQPILDQNGDVFDVQHIAGLLNLSGASFGTPVTAFAFGLDAADGSWRIWTQAQADDPLYRVVGFVDPQSDGLVTAITGLGRFSLVDQFDDPNWLATPLVQNGIDDFFLVETPSVTATPEPSALTLLALGVFLLLAVPRRRIRSPHGT